MAGERNQIGFQTQPAPQPPPIKPPLGLRPKRIAHAHRMYEILEAIDRYEDVGREIPIDWLEEYDEILKQLKWKNKASNLKRK